MRLNTGWFSDRGAVYLASGRPVVQQDTGFGAHLPCGHGFFAARDVHEAAEAIDAIAGDYERHAFPREISTWGYRAIVEASRRHGAIPVWAFVPQSDNAIQPPETIEYMSEMARKAGFVVLNLGDAFEGYDTEEFSVAPADYHPNALGHRLLADRLYEALRENDSVLKLGLTGSGRER